jgi:hypothetical protein
MLKEKGNNELYKKGLIKIELPVNWKESIG